MGFWQISKQIFSKVKYRETVLEEFQRLPGFPRKMVLYSSTKFGTLRSWTIIRKLMRFDLGFWLTRKQTYGKLKYTENVFQELQRFSHFPKKMILYLSDKFGILKPWTIFPKLKRFDILFWPTSKQIYRKLKHMEKIFEEFQRLSCFPRKMILYWSTKFGILKPWTIIPKLISFNLDSWQTSKQVYRKLNY